MNSVSPEESPANAQNMQKLILLRINTPEPYN